MVGSETMIEMLEFTKRREGVIHALDGGLWFHRHNYDDEAMAHLVSSDKQLLLQAGDRLGMRAGWLQYTPLKDPRTATRVDAWHWDLRGRSLDVGLRLVSEKVG